MTSRHAEGYFAAYNTAERRTVEQVERDLRRAEEDLADLESRVSLKQGQIDGWRAVLAERRQGAAVESSWEES